MNILVQFGIVVFFLLLSYLIEKKKWYWIISNYSGRTETEKEELRANRYPERVGRLFRYIALGLLFFIVLIYLEIPYTFEISFVYLLVSILAGVIHLSKYEVKAKQKQSYVIGVIIGITVLFFVSFLGYLGYRESNMVFKERTFEIKGQYGERWSYDEVEKVELTNEFPDVKTRLNGFGMSNRSKGLFFVHELGKGKLFLYHDIKPYLFIQLDGEYVYINSKDSNETEGWYQQLLKKTQ